MKAAARMLVLLTAVWGSSLLVPASSRGGYYEGEAARAFLQQQAALRQEADEPPASPYGEGVILFGSPTPYVPLGAPVYGAPPGRSGLYGAPLGWGGGWGGAPAGGAFGSSFGSWYGIGGIGMGLSGVSRSSWSGLRTSWRFGGKHQHPTSFIFSNRGFLGYSRGPWSFSFGW